MKQKGKAKKKRRKKKKKTRINNVRPTASGVEVSRVLRNLAAAATLQLPHCCYVPSCAWSYFINFFIFPLPIRIIGVVVRYSSTTLKGACQRRRRLRQSAGLVFHKVY
uniref:Uncharacterized protein n=1 Tax=Sipha flava TaxID=143950 RepID=A0A2S2QZW5_9HEMI